MKRTALYAALAFAFPAMGQDDALRDLIEDTSVVEVGAGWLSEDARKFGEYTGLREKGGYFLGGIEAKRRNPDTGYYWMLDGTNLGLTSRNLTFESGRQGRWRMFGEYDQLPKYGESALTIFDGAGSDRLTLPTGFAGLTTTDTANTAAGLAARTAKLAPFLKEANLEQERRSYKLGGGLRLTREWSADVTVRREDKEGMKLFGAVIGNSGGNPRAVLAPEPVDYSTTEILVSAAYTTQRLQLQGSWFTSRFQNHADSFTWQNPYALINGWTAPAGFPTSFGQVALAPDNDYSRFALHGGYDIDSHTRMSFAVERGRMEQDEAFLPYTVNPGLTVTTPLPRSSADARIDTTLATLNLSARPLPRLHLHAQARWEEMDNRTPQSTYVYIGGDSTNQVTVANSDRVRTNLPLSTEKRVFKLGGTWDLMPRTKLKFAYDFDEDERTYAEVDRNRTHLVSLGLRRSLTEDLSGDLTVSRARRDGSGYCYNCPYLQSFSTAFTGPQAANNTNWDNLPLLRRFAYADRERDKVRLALTASPHEMVMLQLFADYMRDDYPETLFGLRSARTSSYTIEASYTPTDRLSGHAYYTRDRAKYDQAGRSFAAATKPTLGFVESSGNDWFNSGEDEGDTFGVGVKWVAMPKRLELGLDATWSDMTGRIATATGSALTPAGLPLPDLESQLKALKLHATWRVNRDLSLKAMYWYQKLESNDWQWDTFVPATLPNVITAGVRSPDYDVHFVGVTVSWRFR
jgi:MtrB/PioB family decaheme-associated outer membrane protein